MFEFSTLTYQTEDLSAGGGEDAHLQSVSGIGSLWGVIGSGPPPRPSNHSPHNPHFKSSVTTHTMFEHQDPADFGSLSFTTQLSAREAAQSVTNNSFSRVATILCLTRQAADCTRRAKFRGYHRNDDSYLPPTTLIPPQTAPITVIVDTQVIAPNCRS